MSVAPAASAAFVHHAHSFARAAIDAGDMHTARTWGRAALCELERAAPGASEIGPWLEISAIVDQRLFGEVLMLYLRST